MNRERAKELLPIIQAFAEGKIVQARQIGGEWLNIYDPYFGYPANDKIEYRIKPEPLECWVNVYEDGGIGVYETEEEANVHASIGGSHRPDVKVVHMREVTDED
jgi:hypothetical protein